MKPKPRIQLAAAMAAGALLLGACGGGGEGDAGVGVRSINTNVGLGVDVTAAAPPNTIVRSPRRLDEPSATIPPLEFATPAPELNKPCPTAGPFDFPDVETGVEPAKVRPVERTYRWKVDGSVDTGGGPITIDGFEERTIKNVEDVSGVPGAYRFDSVQTFFVNQTKTESVTTTYQVIPDSPGQSAATSSDAGRGLFLEEIVGKVPDGQGGTQDVSFQPVPPVQMLAFPVEDGAGNAGSTPAGTPIGSRGVDPANGAQLTIDGIVKSKKQVDACGKKVDSWFVDAAQTFTYTDPETGQTQSQESNFDYGVAIQYGSLIIYEKIEAPIEGPVIKLEFRIGEVPKAK